MSLHLKKYALVLAVIFLVGCGGSGSSSSSTTEQDQDTGDSTSGVLVDPYISGATLYQDENNNNQYDTGELVSTATTSTGSFTFDKELTADKIIRIKNQGKHEGMTYDLYLSGKVKADKTIKVISPLTSFEDKGLSLDDFATILNTAAVSANLNGWSISATDLNTDPLSGGLMEKKLGEVTDADLVKIQASLATYGIIKIMNGSSTMKSLSDNELRVAGQTGGPLNNIASVMLANLYDNLSVAKMTTIKSNIDSGRTALITNLAANHPNYNTASATTLAKEALPEPSFSMVVKVALVIMDRLATIGYETCNTTNGNYKTKVTTALNKVKSESSTVVANVSTLGQNFYGMTYQSELSKLADISAGGTNTVIDFIPTDIKNGYDAKKAGKISYRLNDSNSLVAK